MSTNLQQQIASIGRPDVANEATDFGSSFSELLNLQSKVATLTKSIADESSRLAVRKVMTDLVFLLDYLSLIPSDVCGAVALNEVLSILNIVRSESNSLVAFVENHALKIEGLEEPLQEGLDCAAYALKHEVRRIFETELSQVNCDEGDNQTRGALVHSQGVLTNCFQQCLISLARVFDNTLTGACLFQDWQIRRDRSILLCRDLTALIEAVKACEHGSMDGITEKLSGFREGSMQYLMYKDWEQYETFVDEIVSEMFFGDRAPQLLHNLGCYLETLLGHVKARAVLADMESDPFSVPEAAAAFTI